MFNCVCVSSRILWVKFKFSMIEMCVVVVYNPNERDVEESMRFLKDLDRVGNGYRLCVMEDLNG